MVTSILDELEHVSYIPGTLDVKRRRGQASQITKEVNQDGSI